MNDIVLRMTDVRLTRGARVVLAGLSLEVRRGELVALMGASGSGKTSTLRVIAALEPFQAGAAEVDDVRLVGGAVPSADLMHRLRRKVGLVFQFHCLFEHFPALKNVWLAPVHAYGVPVREAERRARDLLAALGIEHRADALPAELSGGEAQRVAIARALAVDPSLLLLDEPTASLDVSRRAELAALLRDLAQDGRTLMLATHDEDFARACATRILYLDGGVVTTDGGSSTAGRGVS